VLRRESPRERAGLTSVIACGEQLGGGGVQWITGWPITVRASEPY